MRICGFNKTTLLDYPGKVASTIFLGGCNFRCPFCQNGILVVAPGEQPDYSQEELLTFLKKRPFCKRSSRNCERMYGDCYCKPHHQCKSMRRN